MNKKLILASYGISKNKNIHKNSVFKKYSLKNFRKRKTLYFYEIW